MSLKGFYVITDEKLTPYENNQILKKVEEALKGGTKIVQLRDKTHSNNFLIPYAKKLKNLCQKYGALFIIDDRIELVLEVNADGVHLGKDDFPPEEARKILKNKIIGVSCYGDLERAKFMESLSVNYVTFGSFYSSPTKPEAKVISKDILVQAKRILKIPICAIGGINLERAKELVSLGADMIAVVSDIWQAKDIKKRAEEYSKLFL
ncbi:thiamine phosphate synthase [Thermodesulfobacterium hydrogeniphilum]|uniref:thiamine phosphate synthase n=1 Tax=Thermodesulfobacterium hydrogeniphilum TaxID=161156 RepID=UPI00057010FA|nr:thiamine phosphate synthase [Thermodesulfobacterium hydrogeniphilum]